MSDAHAVPPDLIIKVADAKARLSELIARAERGETVVIARGDKPVVTLALVEAPKRAWASLLDVMPDIDVAAALAAIDEPYTDKELDEFEGDLDEEIRRG